jgi:hypothetical protein
MGKSSSFGSALATGGGFGIGSALGNAGGATVTVCGGNDTSSYCQFVKFFNIFKMFIVILVFIAVIVYLAYTFSGTKSSVKKMKRGGCGCSKNNLNIFGAK